MRYKQNPAKRRYVTSVSLFIKILVWGWQTPYLVLDKILCWSWLGCDKILSWGLLGCEKILSWGRFGCVPILMSLGLFSTSGYTLRNTLYYNFLVKITQDIKTEWLWEFHLLRAICIDKCK